MTVRKQMGAHHEYAEFRSALELLEVTGHVDRIAKIEAADPAIDVSQFKGASVTAVGGSELEALKAQVTELKQQFAENTQKLAQELADTKKELTQELVDTKKDLNQELVDTKTELADTKKELAATNQRLDHILAALKNASISATNQRLDHIL